MELTPEQWLRVKEIVTGALELAPSAREAFVLQTCLGDAVLVKEVLSLLLFDDLPSSPAPAAVSLAPGSTLGGRYLIQRELGQGGFATTYIALDQQLLNRRVVVKVLTSTETDPYILRKFHEELQALSSLDHPHIVAPLDSGLLPSGAPFIVMQFAEGKTLRSLLSEGRIPLLRASAILTQLARTLAFIHGKGIYHRDLKPDNIIVQTYEDGSDHVRLIDFGIASIVDRGSTAQTRIVGSLSYMAPEQFTGQVNPQTDIYAFGVVAYEVVTGILPFRAGSHLELMQVQREGALIKPTHLHPQLNPDAERLILQALAFQAEKRPLNTTLFADQLATLAWNALGPEQRKGHSKRSRWLWLFLLPPLALTAILVFLHVPAGKPEQMQASSAALSSPLPPDRASQPQTLTVEFKKRHSGVPVHVDPQEIIQLQADEDFSFLLESSKAGHVYIFSLGTNSKQPHILFPSPTSYQGRSAFLAGQPYSVPENTWFSFDGKADIETIFIVWSRFPQPDLETSVRWANPHDRGVIGPSQSRAHLINLIQGSSNAFVSNHTQWHFTADHDPTIGWIKVGHP